MFSFFSKKTPKLSLKTTQDRDPERYAAERERARSKNAKDRLKLAENPKTHLEILYYLAEDQDKKVRRAVASNPSTPVHVSEVLARDDDTDVKLALIKRLTALLPDLSEDQYTHLYAFAAQALGILALDEVLKVRLALASSLKDELYAPPEVVATLARDLERKVSEPILRFCTRVPDDVLIDILTQHPSNWVIEAIATRQHINEELAEAVIETGHVEGGKILIENETARLSDEALDKIIDRARETPEWHKPLALQTHLPARIMRDIISFVDQSVQKLILKRTDMDDITRKDLTDMVQRRVNFMLDQKGNRITPPDKIKQLQDNNALNDDAIRDALALREYDVVYGGLAAASAIPLSIVKKMIETRAAKTITAVVWKAEFEMRTALEIQKTMGKIQPRDILYPRNGNEFPLSDTELQFQIDFFAKE